MLVGEKDYCHKEADMYFIDENGSYHFDVTSLREAHAWCQEEVEFVMEYEHTPVVVSNTFTQEWEMKDYYELAEKYGYRVHSMVVENRHGGINSHGVPDETLEKMKNRFDLKLI
jgi:plasmid replication initiation protein